MGYYVNPEDCTKEDWLNRNCLMRSTKPIHTDGHTLVCLVDNGAFTAAGICFSDEELDAFTRSDDPRHKVWYIVPTELLKPFCDVL